MATSTISMPIAKKKVGRPKKTGVSVGLCLKCGHKVALCGKPFTADIPCVNCLYINSFVESQQPVSGRW